MGGRGLCPIVLVAEEDLPRRADRARLRPEQGSEGEAGAIGTGKNHILRLPHRDMLMGAPSAQGQPPAGPDRTP